MSTTYGSLREKIAAEKRERQERYAGFAKLWSEAHAAGMAAGKAAVCEPMLVRNGAIRVNGETLYGGADDKIIDVVPDGVCGFASVVVYPATSSFARWCAKEHDARRAYRGGMTVRHVGEFNQSLTRKEAYAEAFAEVLRAAGIKAYSQSAMD